MRPLFSDVQCNKTQYKPQVSSLTYHDMIRHLRDLFFLHTRSGKNIIRPSPKFLAIPGGW